MTQTVQINEQLFNFGAFGKVNTIIVILILQLFRFLCSLAVQSKIIWQNYSFKINHQNTYLLTKKLLL